jgi:hypothetical protein
MTLEQKARYWAYEHGLGALVDATRAAKERSEPNISTQVQGGLIRIVRVFYSRRKTIVDPVCGWVEINEAIRILNTL